MAGQESTIHVASAFDRNYITPFYVLLTSLFYNNRNTKLVIHSIATGVSEGEKKDIEFYVHKNSADIFFYDIDEDYVRRSVVVPEDNYFTIATYYRLFLPALLPAGVKKLLYIDTDAIVIGDLRKIYATDIGPAPFAAVPDSYPEIRTDLGLQEKGQYFNAGVLLIDVENWKGQRVTEAAMQFVADYPEKVMFVDQDALNATQIGKWHRLAKGYNVTWFDVALEAPKKELVKDAAIIHYTSTHKPWKALGRNKLRYLYHYYLKKSPHAHHKKYTDFKWTAQHLKQFLFIRILEWYFEHPGVVAVTRKVRGRKRG